MFTPSSKPAAINPSEKATELIQPVGHCDPSAAIKASRAVIAIYDRHDDVVDAVRVLEKAGCDMKSLSIIGRDYQTNEQVTGFYNIGNRMKTWGTRGASWGLLFGMLFGSGVFLVPGIGPLLVAGPIVMWMVGALETSVVVAGASVLGAALMSIGIPKNSILTYETVIKGGKFLLIAHGSQHDVEKAKESLAQSPHQGLEHHN
jgi:hypothetical protein